MKQKSEIIAFAFLFAIAGMFVGALFGKLAFRQDAPDCPSCVCESSAKPEIDESRIV